jgi:NAD(P) transhydrogenase subunit alpha
MIVGVLTETFAGERRVALIPSSVAELTKLGLTVKVQAGAGMAAGFVDADYQAQGATVVPDRAAILGTAELVLQVRSFGANQAAGRADLAALTSKHTLIGIADVLWEAQAAGELAQTGATSFAMELMPRITRAQSMDVLSSMASIAGYKAVLLAAEQLPRMLPMMMTAAGTIAPAKVLVLGAGVAGLQAIASARRLGAVVTGYDIRPAVREQIVSLGAKFLDLALETKDAQDKGGYAKEQGEDFIKRQQDLMLKAIGDSDIVITTALVPGKKAPTLITRRMVEAMRPGSVVVDLAAERGGNCEVTQPDVNVVHQGVQVFGPTNLPGMVPYHASQMYAKNLTTFLKHLVKDKALPIDLQDEITRETLVTRGGEVVHPRVKQILGS